VRATGAEAREEFGIHDCGPCIVFPYFPAPNGSGEPRALTCRARQDNPPHDPTGKAERKYLSPYGERRRLYFAPCHPQWIESKTTPVLIVEAEKSALSLLSWAEKHAFPLICVAVGGVYGWRGTIGKITTAVGERIDEKGPLPDLEIVRGRDVYIWFDSDTANNPMVLHAQKALLKTLVDFGCADRRIVAFPPNLPARIDGPDDFHGWCGTDDGPITKAIINAKLVTDVMSAASSGIDVLDMPEECLDGRLGENYQKYMSAFPRAYALPALLAYASATIPRNADAPRTNVYAAIVGPAGTGKSQGRLCAEKLLDVPESNLIRAFAGSGEQFAQLADAAGNARLFSPDELGHVLTKMQIERASFPFLFTRAWDEDHFTVTTPRHGVKTPPPAIFHCHLSTVGGVVTDQFEKLFGAVTAAGYYDRCLLSLCPTGFQYSYSPFPQEARAKGYRIPRPVRIHGGVFAVLHDWRKADPELGRIVEIALRAATIAACYDGREILKPDELGPARALVDYQRRIRAMLKPNYGETIEGRVSETILRYMKRLGPGVGITRRELFNHTHMYRLSATTAARVIQILVSNGTLAETDGKRVDSSLLFWPEEGDGST